MSEPRTAEGLLRLEYVALDSALLWEDNKKRHDIPQLIESITRYGFKDPPKFEPALNEGRGGIVEGNGRFLALGEMLSQKLPAPRGVAEIDGEWIVPVLFGVDAASEAAAEAYGIDHNALTLGGGMFDLTSHLNMWEEGFVAQLQQLADQGGSPVAFPQESIDRLLDFVMTPPPGEGTNFESDEQKEAVEKGAQDPRAKNVDIIWTTALMGGAGEATNVGTQCCLAVKSGWMYGIQSSGGPCLVSQVQKAHAIQFIDNEFKDYKHEMHRDVVKKFHPKYATVRDVFTKHQCEALGITYYSLEQVLDWAEELREFTDNVIIIPKYDCLDRIPAHFILGYSIPTSYAGTPLPIEAFKGRRVHLLGGSPNRQITFWQALPDDVVSLDNNYLLKVSKYGEAWFPDGRFRSLESLGIGAITNPLYAALVLSLGHFAAYFRKTGVEEAQIMHSEIALEVERAAFPDTSETEAR